MDGWTGFFRGGRVRQKQLTRRGTRTTASSSQRRGREMTKLRDVCEARTATALARWAFWGKRWEWRIAGRPRRLANASARSCEWAPAKSPSSGSWGRADRGEEKQTVSLGRAGHKSSWASPEELVLTVQMGEMKGSSPWLTGPGPGEMGNTTMCRWWMLDVGCRRQSGKSRTRRGETWSLHVAGCATHGSAISTSKRAGARARRAPPSFQSPCLHGTSPVRPHSASCYPPNPRLGEAAGNAEHLHLQSLLPMRHQLGAWSLLRQHPAAMYGCPERPDGHGCIHTTEPLHFHRESSFR